MDRAADQADGCHLRRVPYAVTLYMIAIEKFFYRFPVKWFHECPPGRKASAPFAPNSVRGQGFEESGQSVANSRFGNDVTGAGWIRLNLAPQVTDVNPQHMWLLQIGDAPNLFEDLGMGHDLAGVRDQ